MKAVIPSLPNFYNHLSLYVAFILLTCSHDLSLFYITILYGKQAKIIRIYSEPNDSSKVTMLVNPAFGCNILQFLTVIFFQLCQLFLKYDMILRLTGRCNKYLLSVWHCSQCYKFLGRKIIFTYHFQSFLTILFYQTLLNRKQNISD